MNKPKRPASSTKLVFFGNERLATAVETNAPTLRSLVHAGYEIEAVIANHQDPVSRQKRDLEIGQVAHAYHIPVILPGHKIDLFSKVSKHQTEAAILVAFGQMIPKSVIDLFPKGIINIHPSLLPAYRGPTPIESAILDGEKTTGVSLMQVTPKMDAGPIFAQEKVELTGRETKPELAQKLLQIGSDLLIKNLADILSGQLEPTPQDDSKATYTKKIKKEDGLIDFSEPAEMIERKVRAFSGFPKTRAKVHGQDIIITKVRIAKDINDGDLVLECNPGFIEIKELIAPSGRTMNGADFLRGYKR